MSSPGQLTAHRRSLLGGKSHNLKITTVIETDLEISLFCHADHRNDVYVLIYTQYNPTARKYTPYILRTKSNGKDKISKELNHHIQFIFPIKETDRFFCLDKSGYLYYISTDCELIKISDSKAYSFWSVRPFIYENYIYIALLDGNTAPLIHVYRFVNQGKELVSDLHLTFTPFLDNDQKQLKNDQIQDIVVVVKNKTTYIFAANRRSGMMAEMQLKSGNDKVIFKSFHNLPISEDVSILPFIEANDDKVCILSALGIHIFNISDIIAGYNPSPIFIREQLILESLGIEKLNLLYPISSYPFLLTGKHVVLFITHDLPRCRHKNTAMLMFSLKTCRLSKKIFLSDIKIKSFLADSELNTILIVSNHTATKYDYSNENDFTLDTMNDMEMLINANAPNKIINNAEIIAKSIIAFSKMQDNMDAIQWLKNTCIYIKNAMKSNHVTDVDRKLIYFYLINELQLIVKGVSKHDQAADDVLLVYGDKFEYAKNLRAFAQEDDEDIAKSFPHANTSINEDENPNIAAQFFNALVERKITYKWDTLMSVAPFMDSTVPEDIVYPLLEESLYLQYWEHAQVLMTILVKKNEKKYDDIFSQMLKDFKPVFKNIGVLRNVFESANMQKSVAALDSIDISPLIPHIITSQTTFIKSRSDVHKQIEDLVKSMNDLKGHIRQNGELMQQQLLKHHEERNAPDSCSVCFKPLRNDGIYFECGHGFHEECLKRKMKPLLTNEELFQLEQFSMFPTDEEKEKIDDILLQDCPLCGEIAIKTIDMPFVNDQLIEEFPSLL